MWRTAAYGITSLFMPSRWAAIPRKLAQISLPGIVSTVVFLMLVAVASIVVVYLLSDRGQRYYTPRWFRDISIIIMLIIRIGNLVEVGFEYIILLSQPATYRTADVVSTYVYRTGLQGTQYDLATAAGLFNAVIAFALVFAANRISRKVSTTALW